MHHPSVLLFVAATAALGILASSCATEREPLAPPSVPTGEEPERWSTAIDALIERRPNTAQPVVFLGSSSIVRWRTLAEDMAPLPVVNYGFGGSKIFDGIYWLDALMEGVEPRAVVLFTGTNDIAGDAPRDPGWILARFDELVARLRAGGCDAPILYIAISPTPARERHLALVQATNRALAARCAEDPTLTFVDTATGFLDVDGRPDPRWFVDDRLHLNEAGYASWTRTIRPALEGVLERSDRGRAR